MTKGKQTKSSILNLALRQASRYGLESLSFGELAKEMNMSKSGLFAHFKSKENLQIMVFDLASEIFKEKVVKPSVSEPRGVPRIIAFAKNWILWDSDAFPGGCPIITATIEFDDKPGKMREHVFATQGSWIEGLRYASELAVAEGHFKKKCDPSQFAFELYSFMLGFHLFKRMMNDPNAIGRQKRAFNDLLQRNYTATYQHSISE